MGVGDESFKKPGSVPFKWEEKPGVPKSHRDQKNHNPPTLDHHRSLPTTPRRLAPPPSSVYSATPPPELGSQSFRSTTSLQSGRHRLDPKPKTGPGPALARPLVVSAGCLLSPLFKWGRKKKVAHKASPEHGPEPDCVVSGPVSSEAGLLARRSRSTRKSMSSWEFPSSFSSRRSSSSPRAVRDPEWPGFGLF